VKTDATQGLHTDPDFSAMVFSRTPVGRWTEPEDIGGAAVVSGFRRGSLCQWRRADRGWWIDDQPLESVEPGLWFHFEDLLFGVRQHLVTVFRDQNRLTDANSIFHVFENRRQDVIDHAGL